MKLMFPFFILINIIAKHGLKAQTVPLEWDSLCYKKLEIKRDGVGWNPCIAYNSNQEKTLINVLASAKYTNRKRLKKPSFKIIFYSHQARHVIFGNKRFISTPSGEIYRLRDIIPPAGADVP